MKTTSIALGSYFDNFVKESVSLGRYNNASEVIRAGNHILFYINTDKDTFLIVRIPHEAMDYKSHLSFEA